MGVVIVSFLGILRLVQIPLLVALVFYLPMRLSPDFNANKRLYSAVPSLQTGISSYLGANSREAIVKLKREGMKRFGDFSRRRVRTDSFITSYKKIPKTLSRKRSFRSGSSTAVFAGKQKFLSELKSPRFGESLFCKLGVSKFRSASGDC